jgi:hypothetical protein
MGVAAGSPPGAARETAMSEQEHHPEHSGEAITILKVEPIIKSPGITVTSTSQRADGSLEDRHSAYHDNISPPLRWTNVPDVKSWALVVEDPDAPREHPFLHWMMWNIAGETNWIPQGIGNVATPITPQRGIQGKNDMGGYGWFGPRPPVGHGVHRYYFQMFALSDYLAMGEDTTLNELLNQLKALTIEKGEMMATYEAPAQQ